MRPSLISLLFLLVGCVGREQASVTIRAIAPTGEGLFTPRQPVWEFAVSNHTKGMVLWQSAVEVRVEDRHYSHAGGHIEWPEGVLLPHQQVLTSMIVPARTNAWRAWVSFWPVTAQDLNKAQANAARFGSEVTDFYPHPPDREKRYKDDWHH